MSKYTVVFKQERVLSRGECESVVQVSANAVTVDKGVLLFWRDDTHGRNVAQAFAEGTCSGLSK